MLGVAAAGVADEKHPGEPAHRPWKLQAGYRVLDLSKVPLVIDEPGRLGGVLEAIQENGTV